MMNKIYGMYAAVLLTMAMIAMMIEASSDFESFIKSFGSLMVFTVFFGVGMGIRWAFDLWASRAGR